MRAQSSERGPEPACGADPLSDLITGYILPNMSPFIIHRRSCGTLCGGHMGFDTGPSHYPLLFKPERSRTARPHLICYPARGSYPPSLGSNFDELVDDFFDIIEHAKDSVEQVELIVSDGRFFLLGNNTVLRPYHASTVIAVSAIDV